MCIRDSLKPFYFFLTMKASDPSDAKAILSPHFLHGTSQTGILQANGCSSMSVKGLKRGYKITVIIAHKNGIPMMIEPIYDLHS